MSTVSVSSLGSGEALFVMEICIAWRFGIYVRLAHYLYPWFR
jgi:hypothetical protein